MQCWKFRLLTAQSCLRRGVLNHARFFCCHFFPKYVSRGIKSQEFGFKEFIVNFHRFQEFQDALLCSRGIFCECDIVWYCTGYVPPHDACLRRYFGICWRHFLGWQPLDFCNNPAFYLGDSCSCPIFVKICAFTMMINYDYVFWLYSIIIYMYTYTIHLWLCLWLFLWLCLLWYYLYMYIYHTP